MPTAKDRKIFKLAKGYYGRGKNCVRVATPRVHRALVFGYIGRKQKKRNYRRMWISQINAAGREHGVRYSALINGMEKASFAVNRKMLAQLAVEEPRTFQAIVDQTKELGGITTGMSYLQLAVNYGLVKTTAAVPPSMDVKPKAFVPGNTEFMSKWYEYEDANIGE